MMDAHTARVLIVGGGIVAVGGCGILARLLRPKPAAPTCSEIFASHARRNDEARAIANSKLTEVFTSLPDRTPSGGSAVLKPAANPVVAGLFVSCVHPECGCAVEALCPEASARHGDPAGMMASASPTMRAAGVELADRAQQIRDAAYLASAVSNNEYLTIAKLTDKDLLATGYDPRHGRHWYVKRIRDAAGGRLVWRWALYGPNRFAGAYTRKTSAIRGAYRRNAKIGKD